MRIGLLNSFKNVHVVLARSSLRRVTVRVKGGFLAQSRLAVAKTHFLAWISIHLIELLYISTVISYDPLLRAMLQLLVFDDIVVFNCSKIEQRFLLDRL